MRTFKYKIQSHKRNRHLMSNTRLISQVHNHFIALSRRHYRIYGKCEGYKRANYYRLAKHLTKLKRLPKYAPWKKPYSWALQDCLKRIERGYINFFERRAKRPPKFKGWRKYRSMTFNGSMVKIETISEKLCDKRRVPVAKIRLAGRWYRFWLHRPLEGNVKRVTVKRDTLGDWYLTIVTDDEGLSPEPKMGQAAGFDFGLKTFLTCSDGKKYPSPQFYKKSAAKVAKANRALSRKKRGSKNRERARKHYARTHRKITRQREDHHWKLALHLVCLFDVCFFEDLNLKGMKRLWGKKISDLGFGEFMQKIRWQAYKRCKSVETIGRWEATTPICHNCGQRVMFLELKDREWYCHVCKTLHDRDVNAAINILKVGISTFGGEGVRLASASNPC